MGKDSLIKSTSTQNDSSPEKDEESSKVKAKKASTVKKTTTAAGKSTKAAPKKTKSTATSKPATQAKTQKKTKAAPKKKTAAQAAPKVKKTVAKPKKKVSIKELTFKKFDLGKPAKPSQVKSVKKDSSAYIAPPIITTSDENEFKRLKSLLLRKYDYDMLKKAAAEKTAVDKAVAEKAAAEKAAAQKTPEEPEPSISYKPPVDATKPSDPADKMMKYGFGGLVLLIILLIGASFFNTNRYYIKPVDGAIEIWQGEFAPKGTRLLISLPGIKYSAPVKPEYTKNEVFLLIFAYYKDKAATLLEVQGMPDFDAEKAYLKKALCYSTTPEEKLAVNSRINSINLMVLMSKADAAAGRKTIVSLEAALKHLEEAADLDLDEIQKKQVKQKTENVQTMLAKMKEREAKLKEAAIKAQQAQAQAKKAVAKTVKEGKKAQKTEAKKKEGKAETAQ